MTDKILVIYDGSASGDEGIRLACALAESEGRPIDIVSVSLVHRRYQSVSCQSLLTMNVRCSLLGLER